MASQGKFLLVAVDPDDPGAELVIDEAAAVARDLGLGVRLLTALNEETARSTTLLGLDVDEEVLEQHKNALLARLEKLADPFALNRVTVRCVVGVGQPAQVVVERARLARLVVVGTHGRKGLNRMLFGSVSEAIMRDCPSPVLVVPTHK